MKIIAIGGGELKTGETLKIDKEIIKLTKKQKPKALLIPTASGDSEKYLKTFKKIYEKKLGCTVDVLYLIKGKKSEKEIKEKILSSDLIYVGGGDTEKLLKIWKKKNVDKILKLAYKKGIVLSGLSAGSYCWFRKSLSSSKEKIYKGLSLINLNNVCHYSNKNKEMIRKNFKKTKGVTIALENCSAIEIIDNKFRVIVSKKGAKAYKLYKSREKIIEEPLPIIKKFKPLELLSKK